MFLVRADRDDLLRLIHDRPALRESHRELVIGVIETILAHHTLAPARTDRQPADLLQEAFGIGDIGRRPGIDGRSGRDRLLQARVVVRVTREHAVIEVRFSMLEAGALGLEQILVLQRRQHVDHGARVVTCPRDELGAQVIRLEFRVAAIATDDRSARHVGEIGKRRDAGENRGGRTRKPRHRRFLFLGLEMLRGDVADLVAEHCGELRFILHVGQDAARNVDIAALGCERVDVVGVDNREMPFEFGAIADLRDFLTDALHVFLQLEVIMHTHALDDLGVHRLRFADLVARFLEFLGLGLLGLRRGGPGLRGIGREAARHARSEQQRDTESQKLAWQLRHGDLPFQLRRAGGGKVDRHDRPAAYFRPYFLRKRSTRPPVSSNFCLPV